MKLKITQRKILISLLKIKLAENGYETGRMIVGNSIEDIADMSTRSIARRLFGLIMESDYEDGALILDKDIAEEILGESIYHKDSDAEDAYEIDSNLMGADWNSEQDYGVPRSGLIKQ